jgi:ABC-2 type transport system permease protein
MVTENYGLRTSNIEQRMTGKRDIRKGNMVQLLLGLAIILLVNLISYFLFTRIDLTAERRYSLSKATKQLLKNSHDVIFFKVYLEGDLPPGFRRLANETREMLDEFRAYNPNIRYQFVNPSENPNAKERIDTYKLLEEQGLQPTNLRVNKKGEASQLIIFPGCMVTYKGRQAPVQLLMTQLGQDPQKVLNNSIQALEYNLASAIEKLSARLKPQIAFLEGQGELPRPDNVDFESALSEYYTVDRVTLNQKINALAIRMKTDSVTEQFVNKYRAIIIDKPVKPFDEKDKFIIDQFIMRGGKVLWMVNPVFASMDSLEKYSSTIGIVNDINLEDLLFSYGVRLNDNLLMDLNALSIPMVTGKVGDQPQIEYFPWYFFPILTPTISHPIMNGLNAVKSEFISSVDTVGTHTAVKKTVLLTTSPYTRIVNAPVLIDLDILRKEPDPQMFNRGPQPVAVLLEGEFVSAFQFRLPPEISGSKDIGFRGKSKKTRMVVIADGDMARNQFHYRDGYALPLGYDQYTRQTFGNKDFLMNVMNYLCDDSGLISVRSRELKLRLLDSSKVAGQRVFWQLLNVLLPLFLVAGFGVGKYALRRRRFGTPRTH